MTSNKPGDPKLDEMGERELAEYFEARKDDDTLWEKRGRKLRGNRGASTTFQMRISAKELEEIARAAGGNVSDFVRNAALEKARAQDSHASDTVQKVREQVKELSETVQRL